MKTQSTTEYSIFKFRDDNRDKKHGQLDLHHIDKIMESIKSKNLLHIRPIIVNSDMEVIDGQNRLEAAKRLNVPIFYQIHSDILGEDMIAMNIAKPWTPYDFLNYFCKNGYEEYIKLNDFLKTKRLTLKVILQVTLVIGKQAAHDFKTGKYVFDDEKFGNHTDTCWEFIDLLKKIKGYQATYFTSTARFWRALIELVAHEDFIYEILDNNSRRMIDRIGQRNSYKEYISMLEHIYNYRNTKKITLNDADY
jgi:ParB-like nuclease domain